MKSKFHIYKILALLVALSLASPLIFASTYINDPDVDLTSELRLWLKADQSFTPAEWLDQSSNNNNAIQPVVASQPSLSTNSINFNPSVDFDLGDTLNGLDSPIDSGTEQTLFVVYKHTSNTPGNEPDIFDYDGLVGANRVEVYDDTIAYQGTLFDLESSGNTLEQPNIFYVTQTQNIVNTGAVAVNGEAEITGNTASISGGGTYSIATQGLLDGNLAELIIYNEALDSSTINNIESYLAIKYGITLDANTSNYRDSQSTIVFDLDDGGNSGSADDGNADWFDIAGIGRDDATTLDQRISSSENSSEAMIVSTDIDFSSDNSVARPQINDLEFLIWGHNNSLTTNQTSLDLDTSVYSSRTEREWKFQNTDVSDNLNLKIPSLPSLDDTDHYVLLSSLDQDFSSGYSVLSISESNEFTDVSIPNGTSYMTIATATTLVEMTKSAYSTTEEDNSDTPSVFINGNIFEDTSIDISISISNATDLIDYTIPAEISIPAGVYNGTTPISLGFNILDDSLLEGDESITFSLINPSNSRVDFGDANGNLTTISEATYTIQDDETATIQFSESSSSTDGDEDGAPDIEVNLVIDTTTGAGSIGESQTITAEVEYDPSSTATNGSGEDIEFTSPQTITFDETNVSGDSELLSFSLTDDNIFEETEFAVFNLAITGGGTLNSLASTGPTTQHTLSIEDDETVTVNFENASYNIGEDTGTLNLNLTAQGADLSSSTTQSVEISLASSTAAVGDDFIFSSPLSLDIPADDYSTPQNIAYQLVINDDNLVENTETIVLNLQNPSLLASLGLVDSATISIEDNDNLSVEFTDLSYQANEATGSINYSVLVSGGNSTNFTSQSIQVAAAGSTAINGVDYTFTDPTSITIPTSDYTTPQTITRSISIVDDGIIEANEGINLVLNNPSSKVLAQGDTSTTLTILDDETATIQFSESSSSTDRDEDGAPDIEVNLVINTTTGVGSIGESQTITAEVEYDPSSTATNGSGEDIEFTSPQTITFDETNVSGDSELLSFSLNDDQTIENTENAIFNLSLAGGGTLNSLTSTGPTTQHTLSIEDDDSLVIEFDQLSYSSGESSGSQLVNLLAWGANTTLAGSMTIDLTTLAGSATAISDYSFTDPTTITIPAADYTTPVLIGFNLSILDDGILEGDENVDLQLINPTGILGIGANDTTSISILDDETATVQFETASTTINQGTGVLPINIQLNIQSTSGIGSIGESQTITAEVEYDPSSTAINSPGDDIEFTSPQILTFDDSFISGDLIPIIYDVNDDNLVEEDEIAVFNISINGTGSLNSFTSVSAPNQHTLTIEDDDKLFVEFTSSNYSDFENIGGNLPQLIVGGGEIESLASIEIVDSLTGTAVKGSGEDYTFTSPETLNIPIGDYTTPQFFSISGLNILDDLDPDGNKTIDLSLDNPVLALIGDADTDSSTASNTAYTILDNELLNVQIQESASQSNPTNQSPVFYTIEFTDPIDESTFALSDLDISNSTASNLTLNSITEIAPNNDTTFQVEISSDLNQDGYVNLLIPSGVVDIAGGAIQNESANSDLNNISIDTIPPANPISAPVLASSSDSGESDQDEITNDNTPEINGTCISGDTIKLYANSLPTGDEETCSAGNSFEASYSSLADGDYDFTYSFLDAAGNESLQSSILFVTIDTIEDPVVISSPSNGDQISGSTEFTGLCEANSTVYLSNPLILPNPTPTNCTAGEFSQTVIWDPSANNTNQDIDIYQTDLAGNTSIIETLNFSIDIDPPQISILRSNPSTKYILATDSNNVQYDIVATEDLYNFDITDLQITSTVDSYNIDSLSSINASQYSLNLNQISGEGYIEVTVNPLVDATDLAENKLDENASLAQDYIFVSNSHDIDNDGIPSWIESINLTNAENADDPFLSGDSDSDSDLMKDALENYISNLTCFAGAVNSITEATFTTDSDLDGIPDWHEIYYDSDPCDDESPNLSSSQDTDSDGITDSLEVEMCDLYPSLLSCSSSSSTTRISLSNDSDNDGISDYLEVLTNSNPLINEDPTLIDTDSDGVRDVVEDIACMVYEICPSILSINSLTDSDSGGVPDYEEILDATNPLVQLDDNTPIVNSSSSSGGSSSQSRGLPFSQFTNSKSIQEISQDVEKVEPIKVPIINPAPIASSGSTEEKIKIITNKIQSNQLSNCIKLDESPEISSIANLANSKNIFQDNYVISGLGNSGDFALNQDIIRVEFIKTLLVANCLPILDAQEIPTLNLYGQEILEFIDLPRSNNWVSNVMYSGAYYGFINGDIENKARPAEFINIAEYIKVSVLTEKIIHNKPIPKADKNNPNWYEMYIPEALNTNIISSEEIILTNPSQNLSRQFIFIKIWEMILDRELLLNS